MVTALAFVTVAGVASVVRLVARVSVPTPGGFPLGMLVVNLAGAFALGLVASWEAPVATVVGTAGLGAPTTLSTLSSEVVTAWFTRRRTAVAYLAITLVGGVGLAWLGLRLGG